ncbi:cleavage and polyadenylation specificity factor subunit 2 [Anaeramoeba ignava]|uniref:Cleavage and polyadenylation specificity factor subunit 2 n=1 Tax=Anaeramoeba ignava TaxID=1746090 RepID=A0A9Q0R9H3_ANAIG|nr:cleavage and polyadenylation specificity factor subunit 2 [Anaeramoeba ignava]
MNSIIQFTPLYGVYNNGPICFLLEIDDFTFLLDCGWSEDFDITILQPLQRVASKIDAILLTHSDFLHTGALPYAFSHFQISAPIYATSPVIKLAKLIQDDLLLSIMSTRKFDLFTFKDIERTFENAILLKHSQHHTLSAIWEISKEIDQIIYAVDYNHVKERHLSPALLETFTNPSILITDAYNSLTNLPRRRDRDAQLAQSVLTTLKKGGNVLIPIDISRVLELLIILDKIWEDENLQYFSLIFLNHLSNKIINIFQSTTEWMIKDIPESLLEFKNVKICSTLQEVEQLPNTPKVVLTGSSTLETGFSKELFIKWCQDPNNLVLFINRENEKTLNQELINKETTTNKISIISITHHEQKKLEGEELEKYLLEERALREQEEQAQKAIEYEYGEDDDEMVEQQEVVARNKLVKIEKEETVQQSVLLSEELFGQDIISWHFANMNPNLPRVNFPMFPVFNSNHEFDSYGEKLDPQFFDNKFDSNNNQIRNDFYNKSTTMLRLPEREEEIMLIPLSLNKRDDKDSIIHQDENFTRNYGHDSMQVENLSGAIDELKLSDLLEQKLPIFQQNQPVKFVEEQIQLQLLCKVKFVDLEGRSDGKSVKNIISHVKPRKLVIVHGAEQETSHLSEYLNYLNTSNSILAPRCDETMDISSNTNMVKAAFSDEFLQSLNFVEQDSYRIAFIDSLLHFETYEKIPLLEPVSDVSMEGHDFIFIGDLKLSKFREKLTEKGINAQFVDGSLVCQGGISMNKDGEEIVLEGEINEDYYKIRDLLYGQYNFV